MLETRSGNEHGLIAPASSAQRRMYFAWVMKPESTTDNWTALLSVDGDLDVDRLGRALEVLRRRHDAFRTTFLERDGDIVQVVRPAEDGAEVLRHAEDGAEVLRPAEDGAEVLRHAEDGAGVARPVADVAERTGLLAVVEAEGDSPDVRRDWALAEARRLANLPFDLTSGPLWRTTLIRIGAEQQLVLFAFHHIVQDEISAQIFAEELRLAYADPEAPALAAPVTQYADFCVAEQSRGVDREGLDYWRGQLEGVEPPRLPEDGEPELAGIVGGRLAVPLADDLAGDLEAFCQERRITPFTGLLAAYFVLLGRWAGTSDVTVGAQMLGRPHSDFFRTIGFFANTVVLRSQVLPAPSFAEFLGGVEDSVHEALEYQDVPFEVVVNTLAPQRDADRNPLFQANIEYDTLDPNQVWVLDGLRVTPVLDHADEPRLHFDLNLRVQRLAGQLGITVEYARRRFSDAVMQAFAAAYGTLLRSLIRTPEVPLGSISLLDEVGRAQMLALGAGDAVRATDARSAQRDADARGAVRDADARGAVRDADARGAVRDADARDAVRDAVARDADARDAQRDADALGAARTARDAAVGAWGEVAEQRLPGTSSVAGDAVGSGVGAECTSAWELFELTVAATPDLEAVRAGEERLTFAELADRARSIAAGLRARGVRTGTLAGICLPRQTDLLVAMLGVWCAGGAFLLLDSQQSVERRRMLLEEASAELLISDESFAETETVPVSALMGSADSTVDTTRRPAAAPAYVVFTSGSTGKPKCVVVDQAGLVAHATTQLAPLYARLPEGRQATVAGVSTVTFDAFISQCMAMAALGHTLVLIDDDERMDPSRILARGNDSENALDVLDVSCSQLEILIDGGLLKLPHRPKILVTGYEKASDRLWQSLRDEPDLLAFTSYGVTECTIESTLTEIRDHPREVAGRAAGASRLYILDDQLQLLPPLFAGEVFIGGPGVGHGYRGRPEQTSVRFIADPLTNIPGQRMYRTGDKGRLRPDGQLEILGRVDDQIQIGGVRIEPGEVESALAEHPGIVGAAVVATDENTLRSKLIAYVVPVAGHEAGLTTAAVRDFLRASLSSVMLPDRVVLLDKFPLSASGKLDRKALAARKPPQVEPSEADARRETATPADPREQQLCEVVAEVLGIPQARPDDGFLSLGGTSLLAMQVTNRVRAVMACDLSVRAVFDAETIRELAAQLTVAETNPRPTLRGRRNA
ncbi:condensation domain-containing protein [Kribbella sp. NPDC056861]|uniref:condensation domain-containing protein n=1 Tax=Kribbella sp. NPDC056861 TaxID=3154857 RepID=UPI003441F21F